MYSDMMIAYELFWLLVPAVIWGVTNPLIKRQSSGIENVYSDNIVSTLLMKFKFVFLQWKIFMPFFLNQIGSIAYFFTLKFTDISIAVPVVNSLTLVITSITGSLVVREKYSWRALLGMLFVVSGVSLCLLDSL